MSPPPDGKQPNAYPNKRPGAAAADDSLNRLAGLISCAELKKNIKENNK
jgi:hypothetical protein